MHTGLRRGFTLIEMLVVIAIIAVLAAILFPVFARVQENGRKTACISNMHALAVAVQLYKDDHNDYPPMLLGYAERPDGLPWQPGDPGPVAANRLQHSLLMPYLKSGGFRNFQCPDNPEKSLTKVVTAVYPANTNWSGTVSFGQAGFNFRNLPPAYQGKPIYFYAADSYDITGGMDANGGRTNDYVVAYATDWTGGAGVQDAPNQPKYRNAENGKTVLSYCNYHVTIAGGNQCPVMLFSAKERNMDYKQVLEKSWNVANTP